MAPLKWESNLLLLLLGLLRGRFGVAVLLFLRFRDFEILHLAVGCRRFGHCVLCGNAVLRIST
jgi:hypothetical protein